MLKLKDKLLYVSVLLLTVCAILLVFRTQKLSHAVSEAQADLYATEAQYKLADGLLYGYTPNDDGKLFFGEWEVVSQLRKSEFKESIPIGTVFSYDSNSICMDGKIITDQPIYRYYIIPKEDVEYISDIPNPLDFNISGDYFLLISANPEYGIGTYFYFKDDRTLILITAGDGYYELNRVSYDEW